MRVFQAHAVPGAFMNLKYQRRCKDGGSATSCCPSWLWQ